MKFERLGNIADIIAGQSPPSDTYNQNNEGLPFFQGNADFGEMFPVIRYWCKEPKKIAFANDILMTVRAPVGPVNICDVESCIGRGLSAIRVNNDYNYKYIYYFLKSHEEQIANLGVGSTFKSITQKEIGKLLIPIPEKIEDQIRIATILSKTETLINKRKESIALLDEFLKSTFWEMFGDPVRNDKKWKIDLMANIIIDIKSGTSYSGEEKKELTENELGVLKISAVTGGYFNQNEFKAVAKDVIKKKIIPLKKGMFLVSRANTRELVAASCIVPQEYPSLFLPDKLWSLSVDKTKANDLFLNYLFKIESYRNIIREKASGGHESMLNISMAKFKKLKLPIPPLTLQDHFAQIVKKTDSIKTYYQTSLQELENLYSSLSQRAFKGELDLSKLDVLSEKEYSSRDNVSVQIKKQKYYGGGEAIISKPDKNEIASKTKEESKSIWRITRIIGKTKGINFNVIEGRAILNDVFKKKQYGFSFQEFEQFLQKENFKYTYTDLQEFIFQQLEDKKLLQYYANEEWMRSSYKKADQDKDDFVGEGNIWLMINNSNGKK